MTASDLIQRVCTLSNGILTKYLNVEQICIR